MVVVAKIFIRNGHIWNEVLNYKIVMGFLSALIGVVSFIPYFRDIFRGHTKPHTFTWLVWGVLTSIAFFVQLVEDGGPGTWITGVSALACFVVAFLAMVKGETHIVLVDGLSLLGAFISLIGWWLTQKPLVAVILISLTDAIGFIPTIRKSYHKPQEETASTFALSGFAFFLSLFALESFSLTTWLYPVSIVVLNTLFVTLLLVRRRKLNAEETK